MNDLVLILMYIAIVALMVGGPYAGYCLWKKDMQERAEIEAFNKWYKAERLRQIKEHKVQLLELKRKRMELEIKWELEYKDKQEEIARQVEEEANRKAIKGLSAAEVLRRSQIKEDY